MWGVLVFSLQKDNKKVNSPSYPSPYAYPDQRKRAFSQRELGGHPEKQELRVSKENSVCTCDLIIRTSDRSIHTYADLGNTSNSAVHTS